MSEKLHFFRQSGWLVMAGTLGGVCMYLVHIPAQRWMPEREYGVFTALLQVLTLMAIPSIGLQTVFAQQAAAAVTDQAQAGLRGAVRALLSWTTALWGVFALAVFFAREPILSTLKIGHPAALAITVLLGLLALWSPITSGLLQGRQNFVWLGASGFLAGLGRFLSVLVLLFVFTPSSTWAMVGVTIGVLLSLAAGVWQNRDVFHHAGAHFAWGQWLRRAIPLSLGMGASQFMLGADMIFVQSMFEEGTGYYAAAGMIGRALVTFTGPMMTVMFPKIARSAALSEKSDVLALALGATALLGVAGALGCTLLPALPLLISGKRDFLVVAPLLPWFAWCMLPLTLANVLISNLLARERFEVVPWLVLVAAAYGATQAWLCPHYLTLPKVATAMGPLDLHAFKLVVQTLGAFGLLLLGVCAWFTWGRKPVEK